MLRRFIVAMILVGVGWIAALAQAPEVPDFELSVVVAPDGKVTIDCVRGCGLQWTERMVPNRNEAKKSFVGLWPWA